MNLSFGGGLGHFAVSVIQPLIWFIGNPQTANLVGIYNQKESLSCMLFSL